jgi:hypothetical protein
MLDETFVPRGRAYSPVAPVGPVLPTGPVAPVGPVGPTGPVGPVGPVDPVGPPFVPEMVGPAPRAPLMVASTIG